jgi:hypothetical protein
MYYNDFWEGICGKLDNVSEMIARLHGRKTEQARAVKAVSFLRKIAEREQKTSWETQRKAEAEVLKDEEKRLRYQRKLLEQERDAFHKERAKAKAKGK